MQRKEFKIGKYIVMFSVFALGIVSGTTTFMGLSTFLEHPLIALLGACGIQGFMIGILLTLHGVGFCQRVMGSAFYLMVALVSVSFSYAGLNGFFTAHLTKKREPLIARAEVEQALTTLDAYAHKFRAAALGQLRGEVTSLKRAIKRHDADARTARRLSRRQFAAKRTSELRVSLEGLEDRLRTVESWHPRVGRIRVGADVDAAYARLQEERDALMGVWSEMPSAFRGQYPLPPLPMRHTLLQGGRFREGADHPLVEVFMRLRHPEPPDLIALAVAFAFDLIPLVAMWALIVFESLDRLLRRQRFQMVRIHQETEAMPGLIPWGLACLWQVFFGPARDGENPWVRELRQALTRMQESFEDLIGKGYLSPELRPVVSARIASLRGDIEMMGFRAAAAMIRKITETRQQCLDDLDETFKDDPIAFAKSAEQLNAVFDNLGDRVREIWRTHAATTQDNATAQTREEVKTYEEPQNGTTPQTTQRTDDGATEGSSLR